MDFLLTKLNGIFQFIPPLELIEKCQMTPFLPFERNSSMPALAGAHKTIAKGIYRLLLKSRAQSSFPMSEQQVNREPTNDPAGITESSSDDNIILSVQHHCVSSPFPLTGIIFPKLYGPDARALTFVGPYTGFWTLTQRPYVTAFLLLFTQRYSAIC